MKVEALLTLVFFLPIFGLFFKLGMFSKASYSNLDEPLLLFKLDFFRPNFCPVTCKQLSSFFEQEFEHFLVICLQKAFLLLSSVFLVSLVIDFLRTLSPLNGY